MSSYQSIQESLILKPKTWLITGVAGFIGSNLLEKLLQLNQTVIGIDNFSTGHRKNLDDISFPWRCRSSKTGDFSIFFQKKFITRLW